MGRPALEVADIFRAHGSAWRQMQQGHLSLGQLKVMSAIEQCRSAALGGHVLRCEACEQVQIAYNSCRNRHCPKCQASAARRWLEARQADLLPVEYYHVVFTLPAPIAAIAYSNKAVIYDLLFAVAAETLRTIAADPKHLGAEVGVTLVLHTWGSALTHHPHVHGIVPGGGLATDGERWVRCQPGFFLPVRVLSRLFRRRFLEELEQAHRVGRLQFFGEDAALANAQAFAQWLAPLRACEWVVYAKPPFAAANVHIDRATHVHLPTLLGGHARCRNLHPRAIDPRATTLASRSMITDASSASRRPLPIADGIASRSKASRYVDATTKDTELALLILRINAMSATSWPVRLRHRTTTSTIKSP